MKTDCSLSSAAYRCPQGHGGKHSVSQQDSVVWELHRRGRKYHRNSTGIEGCDLNIKSNNSSHHTELYGEERLIVRRAQESERIMCLQIQRPLPRRESDTKVTFSSQGSTVDTEWSPTATEDASGSTVTVSISSSPKAPIGLYTLTLDQLEDAVYMQSEKKRKEYVLAQHGLVYRGTHTRIKGKPWNLGQFEPAILDICLKILDDNPKFESDADKDISSWRNPIYVTRVLSAMVIPIATRCLHLKKDLYK
ncbi:hypothetical protein CHARACLAT_002610 [Characodon lateralis]|uniref:Transglutaminase N-terminal domain-containing protein n=1 Tax=Characodon lateralis TaxID=208331 RepID=A0ABU7CJW9_9TELE|nr:hypothetical protein [Characodon lateralis]